MGKSTGNGLKPKFWGFPWGFFAGLLLELWIAGSIGIGTHL